MAAESSTDSWLLISWEGRQDTGQYGAVTAHWLRWYKGATLKLCTYPSLHETMVQCVHSEENLPVICDVCTMDGFAAVCSSDMLSVRS